MRKVLWLSNFLFADSSSCSSGTWIESMGRGLCSTGQVDLHNITVGAVDRPTRADALGIKQWILPVKPLIGKPPQSLPPMWYVNQIKGIVDSIAPDLIHVWGTERFWGILTARKMLDYPALLEMQGLTSAMSPYMTGCLSMSDQFRSIGLKELLRPGTTMWALQRQYQNSLDAEREIICGHHYIDYQSEWVRSHLIAYGAKAELFRVRMTLRPEFLSAIPRKDTAGNHTIFTSCGWSANKGVHILTRALKVLKASFPDVRLVIAGRFQTGIRQSGYARMVLSELKQSGLLNQVEILGAVDAARLIDEMRKSAVVVIPSLVESYSLSLAEAMAVGCPCVATYAGAMPEVGGDTCLYFPVGDVIQCAMRVAELFADERDAAILGKMARQRSVLMHSLPLALSRQMEVYTSVR